MYYSAGIKYFPPLTPEIVRVELGDPYSRNCTPPQSMPAARVYWIFKGDDEGSFDSINGSHISTNEQVGLIFFYYFNKSIQTHTHTRTKNFE